jgi:hypothetical protein
MILTEKEEWALNLAAYGGDITRKDLLKHYGSCASVAWRTLNQLKLKRLLEPIGGGTRVRYLLTNLGAKYLQKIKT